jgi:23S rRNA (cytidine1920-2'-O)/16S rRNA (cytidine1409-2'-O)-methyltransferase
MAKKERLDQLLVQRGLTESREQARRLIRAGGVLAGGQLASKPGHTFDAGIEICLKEQPRFVSRGGEKLEAAFASFGLAVEGCVCVDVGASTGGFTDCLLQHGAARVYAVDVGRGQLHWKLRNDARVVVMEKCNARYLQAGDIPEAFQVIVSDVSFISLTKVLPPVVSMLDAGGDVVALIKPQFEAGREQVGKGGVVRDEKIRLEVVANIRSFCEDELQLICKGIEESPVRGPAGNVEFVSYWKKP